MKIVFLDIDGVLNNLGSAVVFKQHAYNSDGLDKTAVALVKWICEVTGAKVVISSSWRILYKHEMWFDGLLEAHGWRRPPIIGMTPVLYEKGKIRGDEINAYLDTQPGVRAYVCLDDDSDFHENQNLVLTDGILGLTLYEAVKAAEILGVLPEHEGIFADIKKHTTYKEDGRRFPTDDEPSS